MSSANVLVTGLGGPSGSAAATALIDRGFTVYAVDMLPIETDIELAGFYRVPPAREPEFFTVLEELLAARDISWLFPTVQEELPYIALMAPALRQRGISVFIADEQTVHTCDDKLHTMQALRAAGVAVPDFLPADAPMDEVAQLGLPVISKPRIGRGGRGVQLHRQLDDVFVDYKDCWQTFMPGVDYDVLTVLDPRDSATILAQQVFEKTELREGVVGNANVVKAVQAPAVAQLASDTVRALKVSGPTDIDIRLGDDGLPRVLEINARIGAHTLEAPAIFDALVQLYNDGCRG